MKKTLLLICICLFSALLYGQNTKNLKIIDNSEKIIRKGIKTADQGKFDDAIALYNQVPYGDPNYEYAQYEKAYALEMAERYHEAIQILTELTENPSCSQPLANIYTELGKYNICRMNLLNILSGRVQQLDSHIWTLKETSLRERIIRFVKGLSDTQTGFKKLSIKMNDLALLMEATRLNVSRELNSLEADGLISLRRKEILIPALEKLV